MSSRTHHACPQTELPSDYLSLEKRVDALQAVHKKMLQVTSQYTNESYDYPPNLRESFNDLGRTISEKVNLLFVSLILRFDLRHLHFPLILKIPITLQY